MGGPLIRRVGEIVSSPFQRAKRTQLRFSEEELVIPSGTADFDISIALVPDLDAGGTLQGDSLMHVISALNERQPDVICLMGNAIHSSANDLRGLGKALEALTPSLGTYAIASERERHSYFQGSSFRSFLDWHGVGLLSNCGVRLNRKQGELWLSGVDTSLETASAMEGAMNGRSGEEVTVLLSREAKLFEEAVLHDVDLQFSVRPQRGAFETLGHLLRLKRSERPQIGKHWLYSRLLYVCRELKRDGGAGLLGDTLEVPILRLRSVQRAKELAETPRALQYSRSLRNV